MSGETLTVYQEIDELDLAAIITEKYSEWDSYREPAKERWKEIEAYLYATDTTHLPNFNSPFEHTTHIPVVAPIAQDLEAIVSQVTLPHEDWFEFKPYDKKSASYVLRNKIKSYIKNRHALSGFNVVAKKLIADLITYGVSFALVHYVDETNNGEKVGYDGPKVKRISPYDIVFDPTACAFEDSPKIIRELITLGELKKRANKGLLDADVVNEILSDRRAVGSRSSFSSNHYKDQQYVPSGFGSFEQYVASGTIELLWFYGDMYDPDTTTLLENKQCVVAEGKYVLLNEDIKSVDGKVHLYKADWQIRQDNLWPMGPLDNIIGLNYQVNHRENAKSDALDKLIVPDRVFMGDVERIYDDETGATEYNAPEGGGVQELGINTQFFSFDLHIDRLTQSAQKAARLPNDLVGFRSAGEKTLGEVTALTEGGMRGFLHKAQDFERFLEQILTAEVEIARENLSSVIQVAGQVESGIITFLDISAEDLKMSGALVATGARRFARKQQILGTLTQLSATPLYQQTAMHTSGVALAKLIAELTETTEEGIFEEYIAIQEQSEAQKMQQRAEQEAAISAGEPTLQERMLMQEEDALDAEGMM